WHCGTAAFGVPRLAVEPVVAHVSGYRRHIAQRLGAVGIRHRRVCWLRIVDGRLGAARSLAIGAGVLGNTARSLGPIHTPGALGARLHRDLPLVVAVTDGAVLEAGVVGHRHIVGSVDAGRGDTAWRASV